MIRYTRDEWVEKCKATHGERYDYSRLPVKVNSTEKFELVCREHGVFKQYIRDHIKGSGCQKCSGKHHSTIEELKARAGEIHLNKYDYSLWPLEYRNNRVRVTSICREHGKFTHTIFGHVSTKSGCPACAGVIKTTVESFTTRASKIHQGRYNYSLVKGDLNVKSLVRIICPDHGEFIQQVASHLHMATGCPKCSNSVQKMLYVSELPDFTGVLKYGIAVDVKRRLKSFRVNNKIKSKLVKCFVFDTHESCRKAEKDIKDSFPSVLSKSDISDGYTETTFSCNIGLLIDIAIKHGGKACDTKIYEKRGMLSL